MSFETIFDGIDKFEKIIPFQKPLTKAYLHFFLKEILKVIDFMEHQSFVYSIYVMMFVYNTKKMLTSAIIENTTTPQLFLNLRIVNALLTHFLNESYIPFDDSYNLETLVTTLSYLQDNQLIDPDADILSHVLHQIPRYIKNLCYNETKDALKQLQLAKKDVKYRVLERVFVFVSEGLKIVYLQKNKKLTKNALQSYDVDNEPYERIVQSVMST